MQGNISMGGGDSLFNEINLLKLLPKNAGMHNSIYRGEDITDLFYNGTLSQQIADQTFDDIFIGDYIIGKESQNKYLVADLNYYYLTGENENTKLTIPHVTMIPAGVLGNEAINSEGGTAGGYLNSEFRITKLSEYVDIIKNDFIIDGTQRVLKHRNYFSSAIPASGGYPSSITYADSEADLMNEVMVFGSYIFAPKTSIPSSTANTIIPRLHPIDNSQLSLFRLNHSAIYTDTDSNRIVYWLRDLVDNSSYASVRAARSGYATSNSSSGIRPVFIIH